MFGATCLTPQTAPTIRRLADLNPTTLAIMHGSSYNGDAGKALHDARRRLPAPAGPIQLRTGGRHPRTLVESRAPQP